MDLGLAKPRTQLLLLLGRHVLVPEENHAPLGNQQSQLVALHRGEVLELEPFDLGPDVGGQVRHLGGCRQEIPLGLVGSGTGIFVEAVLAADLVDVLQINGPGGPVQIAFGQVDACLEEPLARGLGEREVVLSWLGSVNNGLVDRSGRHLGLVWEADQRWEQDLSRAGYRIPGGLMYSTKLPSFPHAHDIGFGRT